MSEENIDFTERCKEMNPDLKWIYEKIIYILKKYCDLREDYYPLIALWIIGTWCHDNFSSYPYLFFNAMRGSGKTRLMNLVASLCKNGKVLISMSESVLFRTAKRRTLCIDEFEGINSKENRALKELLNSAYKKGGCVERAIKKTSKNGDSWEIERYDVYCPIVMANIWGMDSVLGDRCITLILEKSNKKNITMLMEDFNENLEIRTLYEHLDKFWCRMSVGVDQNHVKEKWNMYVQTEPTLNITNTPDTSDTKNTEKAILVDKDINLFSNIVNSGLEGRHLELFFPLFILADEVGILNYVIEIAKKIIKEKKEDDLSENRDIALIMLLSRMDETSDFIRLKRIADLFNEEEETDKENKISPEWVGRALKRLGLIIEKRRLKNGREVKINFSKLREKARMFRISIPEKEELKVKEEIVGEIQELKECSCGLKVPLSEWDKEKNCCNLCAGK